VIDTVTHKGTKAPTLDPDQLKMAGLLVPADLSPNELHDVISALRASTSIAHTPEDVIVAIGQAVHDVRNKNRTVTVDGVTRPDLARPGSADEGPITSPSQVDPDPGLVAPNSDEALVIVRDAPPEIIGRWFQADDRELALGDEAADWKARHLNTRIGGQMLLDIRHFVTNRGEGKWEVKLVFTLQTTTGQRLIEHNFFVDRGRETSGLGARVGDLTFEPFILINFR
jgi:hypothetical protein